MNSSQSTNVTVYRRSFLVTIVFGILTLAVWLYEQLSAANSLYWLCVTGVVLASGAALISAAVVLLGKKIRSLRQVSFALYTALLLGISLLLLGEQTWLHPYAIFWAVTAAMSAQWQKLGVSVALACITIVTIWSNFAGSFSAEYIFLESAIVLTPLLISLLGLTRQKQDTTDQTLHVLAQELSQVSNKSDIIINAIGEGVVAVDNRGVIQLMNPAAEDLTGWTNFDALGLNYRTVLKLTKHTGEIAENDTNPITKVLHGSNSLTVNDLLLVTNSGKKLEVSLLVSPIGKFGNGAIIVFRDITTEAAANRQQVEFISTASHEMRTPVAAIEGYVSLAINPQTATIDERARGYLSKAHESAQHLGRLFQDLLDVSKAEDGRLKNEPQLFNAVDFIRESVLMMTPKATEHNLGISYIPDAPATTEGGPTIVPTAYVNVDPDHLREIMTNLIDNAIKYTKQGDVVVNVTSEGDLVKISIKDSGIGIAPEDIPHLFQKFYRIDSSDTREIGGTGLGLYLCRRLVESMEGHIWLESELGSGSTFYLTLPRIANERVQAVREKAAQTQAV